MDFKTAASKVLKNQGSSFSQSSRDSKVNAVSSAYFESAAVVSNSPFVFERGPVSIKSDLHLTVHNL